MMGVAAGMAMNGLRPVAYICPFVTTRCIEQVTAKTFATTKAPVTIVAVGASLAYSGLGPTPSPARRLVSAFDSEHGGDLPR